MSATIIESISTNATRPQLPGLGEIGEWSSHTPAPALDDYVDTGSDATRRIACFFVTPDTASTPYVHHRHPATNAYLVCFSNWERTSKLERRGHSHHEVLGAKPALGGQDDVDAVLQTVYVLSWLGEEPKALKTLYAAVEGAFAKENLAFVEQLLNEFDANRVKRMVSVGLLRGTYRARRHFLQSWDACLGRVAIVLAADGQPVNHLLRGLINTNGSTLFAKRQAI